MIEENESKEKQLEYELQEALVKNFFAGYYFITFEEDDNKQDFFNYIGMFDFRFGKIFKDMNNIKEVVWKYSKLLHHHQLECSPEIYYFKMKDVDLQELKYKKIKTYIESCNEITNNPFMQGLKNLLLGKNDTNKSNGE